MNGNQRRKLEELLRFRTEFEMRVQRHELTYHYCVTTYEKLIHKKESLFLTEMQNYIEIELKKCVNS